MNDVSMLANHLFRRCPFIETALDECLVFAGCGLIRVWMGQDFFYGDYYLIIQVIFLIISWHWFYSALANLL